jgi:hypothetical protein
MVSNITQRRRGTLFVFYLMFIHKVFEHSLGEEGSNVILPYSTDPLYRLRKVNEYFFVNVKTFKII